MYTKIFVSLYFSENTLQLIEMDASKKRVVKKDVVPLPKGIIDNSKVKDSKSLSVILSQLWKKNKIKDKFISIVIPEYAAFVKTLEIPVKNVGEINEAVNWQMQEFLPSDINSNILDWKVIEKKSNGYTVLAACIENSVLEGYIKSCEIGGLYPVIVETPSLALSRLVGGYEPEKSTLFIHKGIETTIVLVEKGKFISSSILFDSDEREILITLKRIISHFFQKKIEKIIVCGENSGNLVSQFEEVLKIKTEVYSDKKNKEVLVKQEDYLIPIASQMQNISSPDDPTTLNLLPKELSDIYKNAKKRLQLWSLTLAITLFVWFTLFSTIGVYIYFRQILQNSNNPNTNTENGVSTQTIIKEITSINTLTAKIDNIIKNTYYPENLVNEMYNVKPDGIEITAIDIDFDQGVGTLGGISTTRDTLLLFADNLKGNENLGNVLTPITSYEKVTNIEFEIQFDYLPISVSKTKSSNK